MILIFLVETILKKMTIKIKTLENGLSIHT